MLLKAFGDAGIAVTAEQLAKRRHANPMRAHRLIAWLDATKGWRAAGAAAEASTGVL